MEFYFFWKHRLGQWTLRDIIVEGVRFNCCEQFMMAAKASLFGDQETLSKIMAESDPKKQQCLGRTINPFDEDKWNEIARDVVFIGNLAKFTQHQDLEELLLSTGDKILVEASPKDPIWGIGLASSDPRAQDPAKWLGKNWLGETLMKVRAEIRNRRRSCPCHYTTPCDPSCTCVNGRSSRGCRRCCSYGSVEQRTAMAKHLVAKLEEKRN